MTQFPPVVSGFISLPAANIDTDAIVPARFLLSLERRGLGRCLFADERAGDPTHPLDRPGACAAHILVAGPNFGCGSSREHAVWALHDFGIRVVIAPSIGEIFYLNCFRNGVLPIVPGPDCLKNIAQLADDAVLRVDLQAKTIDLPHGATFPFDIDEDRRIALLEGLDEIALIDRHLAAILDFEARQADLRPWLATVPALIDVRQGGKVC